MSLEQVLRLGTHAEAEFLRKLPSTYDCLMMNCNLVVATPAASAALVFGLEKRYFLDPFTHAFALPHRFLTSKSKDKEAAVRPKSSFRKLAERYFGSADFVGRSSLKPSDIDPVALAANVLDYQETWYLGATEGDAAIRTSTIMKPTLRIAPYFILGSNREFLDANIGCVNAALALDQGVAAIIPLSLRSLLEGAQDVVDSYVATGVTKVFLWIENFDEDLASCELLTRYVDLVSYLNNKSISVYNLFGGFFSCIAHDKGLSGFVHGLVYGENKSFVPVVGGGQPPPRYYMKPRHITMGVSEVERLLSNTSAADYLMKVCDCTICRGILNANGMPNALSKFSELNAENKFTPRAYALCRFHFLLARRDEVDQFPALDRTAKLKLLNDNIQFLDDLDAEDLAGHLRTWQKFI